MADRVIETWVQARLLTSDRHPETREPTIEVAHEAVLQRWPRLLGWIDADREWLRALGQLRQAAATWQELDEDPGALLRGARLERALEVTGGRTDAVPVAVRRFLDASVATRDAEAAREAEVAAQQVRTNRRLRTQRLLLAAALVLAVIVGAVAVERQVAASRNAAAASRNAAAADARARAATTGLIAASDEALDSDWSLALLLATEAYRIDDSPATRRGLVTALTTPRPVPSTLYQGEVAYQAVDVDDARDLVIAKEEEGPIHLVDADSGDLVGEPLPAPALLRVGGLDVHDGLVAAGGLAADGASAVVYDLDSREQVATIPAPPDESAAVAFSPDGRRLAVSGTGRVRLFDVADWSRTRTLTTGDDEPLRALAWDPDGTRLYAGGFRGDVLVWDVDPAPPSRSQAEPVQRRGVAVRPEWVPIGDIVPIPDSDLLAVTSFESTLYLVDATTLRIVEGPLAQDNLVTGLSVDPTADRLAVAMVNQVAIWSLPIRRLPDSRSRLEAIPTRDVTLITGGADVSFAPDGELVSVGLAGEVTSWALDPRSPVLEPIPGAAPGIPTFSPDGDVLAMWGGGEGVRLLDADTYELRSRLDIADPQDASIASIAFLPDARVAVAWCPDKDPQAEGACRGRLAVFDRASGRAVVGPVAIDDVVDSIPSMLAASPDGELLAVGYEGARVEVRDTATLDVVHELDDLVRGGENWVLDTSFSPKQPRLFVASTGDDAVWDLSGDTPEVVVAGRTGLTTHFTPDGMLVTSDQDGRLELRDPMTLHVLDRVEGLPSPAISPSFTSDGTLMVTYDDFEAAARLWRLDGLELFGGPIDGVGGTIHPDGSTVVVGGDPVRRLPMDPDAWVRAACETAGRNLTPEEWQRYFVDEAYRRTCP